MAVAFAVTLGGSGRGDAAPGATIVVSPTQENPQPDLERMHSDAPGIAWFNGAPGLRVEVDGELAAVLSVTVEDGLITRIYSVANPDKLARLDAEAAITR